MARGSPCRVLTTVFTSPIAPASISSFARWKKGSQRRVCSTVSSVPLSSTAAIILSASARVVASGFSQRIAGMPRSAASTTMKACLSSGVATSRMSGFSVIEHRPKIGIALQIRPAPAPPLDERVDQRLHEIADRHQLDIVRQPVDRRRVRIGLHACARRSSPVETGAETIPVNPMKQARNGFPTIVPSRICQVPGANCQVLRRQRRRSTWRPMLRTVMSPAGSPWVACVGDPLAEMVHIVQPATPAVYCCSARSRAMSPQPIAKP